MYCWRNVNWTVCLVAVRLCTAGGMWTELFVVLRWGYVLLAECELNCVRLRWGYILLAESELSPLWHSSSKLKGKLFFVGDYDGKSIITLLPNIITGLSVVLSFHPFDYIHPFIKSFFLQSIRPSFYPFFFTSFCLSILPSIHPSSIHPSTHQPIQPSTHFHHHPSIHPFN